MKRKTGNLPYVYPIPIVLAGANVNGKPNFETVGDVGLLGIKPALVMLSSGHTHYTNRGILENGTFSLNFPNTQMLSVVDYCGQVSGDKVDKGALFEVFYGDLETAPLIAACPVGLECRVLQEFSIEHRQIFVGEVVQTHIEAELVTEVAGRKSIADLSALDPIIYALDNRYYQIGAAIGTGYQEAQKMDAPHRTGQST